ncbi:MAG: DUF2510 domain-containing protein [Actinomycetota bacterium]|nr:DUF2510 domain-containing protein [Actinomycetota bacterium]
MSKDWPMKEWPAPPPPAPPEEPQPIAPPAPDPPTEGWWLDPDDPRRIRYHDGQAWTDRVGRSTAPRPGLPAHQAWFPLGAGPEGIPTGSPLAPGEGRFLARTTVWALGGAIIVGLLVGAFGIGALQEGMLGGAAAAAVIALGAVLFFGPMAIGIVSAWRAGFRYPGFSRHSSLFERQMGAMCLGIPAAVVLWLIGNGIGFDTGPGAVLEVVSNVVSGIIIIGVYAIPTIWQVARSKDITRGVRLLGLATALFSILTFVL